MLDRITLASAQLVWHRAGPVYLEHTISIAEARAGVVEADHSN